MSKLFVDAGALALTAFISPFKEDRAKVRNIVGADDVIEVYVECPVEVCEQRDVKGLYAKARAGEISNFTGISSPFEAPDQPDIKVNTAENDLENCVSQIMKALTQKLPL